MKINSFFKNS